MVLAMGFSPHIDSKYLLWKNDRSCQIFIVSGVSTGACRPSIVKREKGTQFARLVMAHIDSDTIPFFWQCASPFVLFDEIFAPWTPDEGAQKIIEKMSRDDDHPGYSDHQIIARNAGVWCVHLQQF
jgi:hypothetical protein